ncbi:MAG TPA: pilus assembly protein TadG-related protein [Lacipirellulaceae bacterium]|nr:pilus assembly protein TadG-related protein [Lacipirellulaceae bacterium]
MRRYQPRRTRRGAITVLAAIMSLVALGLVAFAVDVGYILASKQELQRSADAAALAACWTYAERVANGTPPAEAIALGRQSAADYASSNRLGNLQPAINQNSANSATGDVVFGRIDNLSSYGAAISTASPGSFNAVKVKVRRDATLNGETPFFFARVFGHASMGLDAEATAGFYRSISGVRTPSSGRNLNILPYALDWSTWEDLLEGNAGDSWRWNPATKTITSGSDGVREVNLFPQGTGSPGNRGTVDIGGSNNSTADIARQIVYGISPADMAQHGGSLELDEDGELELNGDTGISAGVKDELDSIKGQPRLIPIFSKVVGPGNNAQYTIVHWAGIRIMDVKLTGAMNQKRVIIQPAPMVIPGAIASSEETSNYVYTPVVLVK